MERSVRALLMTDLVDSTRLEEALGEQRMAEVWKAHDRVARDLLLAHHGQEIDKSDGFLLLFETANDAAGFALAYHAALRDLSSSLGIALTSRAGLHVAEISLRENLPEDVARGAKLIEVDGLAKPTTARIMSIAMGGQTLATTAAAAGLNASAFRRQCHGQWRMKGLAEPIELHEVGDDSSPWQPPSGGGKVYRVVQRHDLWMPLEEIRHTLPAERDAFIGRTEDLQQVARLIGGAAHLVTVLGPGGTGKTRLVRRFGWTWLGDFPGGVYFCDLSDAKGLDGITHVVAMALDVPLESQGAVAQIGAAIHARGPCLVLLDNLEQVVEAVGGALTQWIDRAPQAVFIATSRERLHVPGEQLLVLEPLHDEPALALFTARARAQDQKFTLDASNREDLTAIVRMLDGLPLAIELAASRIRVLSAAQLRERLKERFAVLAGARGVARRQATLRAAIDWSWDLLSPWEKGALAQCSVFTGGFTLDAAEAVLDLSRWPDAPPPMDAVQVLLDKSLLRANAGRHELSGSYFGMYLSIHDYAVEMLRTPGKVPDDGSGPAAERDAWTRHAAHFAHAGTDELLDRLNRHGGAARRQALARELENLVAACRRAVALGDAEKAALLLGASWEVLQMRGPMSLAIELGHLVLTLESLEASRRMRVEACMGAALWRAGRIPEARAHVEAALALHVQLDAGSPEGAAAPSPEPMRRKRGSDAEGAPDSGQQPKAGGRDRRSESVLLHGLARLLVSLGRIEDARAIEGMAHVEPRASGERRAERTTREKLTLDEQEVARSRERGDPRREMLALGSLARLHEEQGGLDRALTYYEAALAIARDLADLYSEGTYLSAIGNIDALEHRFEAALERHEAALAPCLEGGYRRPAGVAFSRLAALHAAMGQREKAIACSESALAIARELEDPYWEGHELASLGVLWRESGMTAAARKCFERALERAKSVGDKELVTRLGADLAALDSSRGDGALGSRP